MRLQFYSASMYGTFATNGVQYEYSTVKTEMFLFLFMRRGCIKLCVV